MGGIVEGSLVTVRKKNFIMIQIIAKYYRRGNAGNERQGGVKIVSRGGVRIIKTW